MDQPVILSSKYLQLASGGKFLPAHLPASFVGQAGRCELAEICRWCDKHGVRLISDEIYHGLVYGKRADTALN